MRLTARLGRLAFPLLVAASLALPAYAGPAENALLAAYAGTWSGSGEVKGTEPGTVNCKMTFKASNAGKLIYNGKCSFDQGSASFNGTMLYNDAGKRYEAAASSTGFSGTAVGKKQGGGVVFAMNNIDTSYGTASSTMALSGEAINMAFKLVDKDGATTNASIVLQRT